MSDSKSKSSPLEMVTSQEAQILDRINEVARANGTYPIDAYLFVQAGVIHAIHLAHGGKAGEKHPGTRHITGKEVCIGIRDLAWYHWGAMAGIVLNTWGIHQTLDLGRIVFALIDAGVLSKQDNDSLDDFRDVFSMQDLDAAYVVPARLVSNENTGNLLPKVSAKTFLPSNKHTFKSVS